MKKILFFALIICGVVLYNQEAQAKRGCCSWHGGVCGCSADGQQVCCDGTLSPSCVCSAPHQQKTSQEMLSEIQIAQATKTSYNEFCLQWQEIYEKVAIMKGETGNVAKVKFINQYQECEDLWLIVTESLSFCHDRGCFLRFMKMNHNWYDINDSINNLYNHLAKNNS